MKKKFILSLFLLVFMTSAAFADFAPLSPKFLKWQEQQQQGVNASSIETEKTRTIIPSPVDLSHLADNPVKAAEDLPVSYDLRGTGRIPNAVRAQNPTGWCWSFAAMGACESNYLTKTLNGEFDGSLGNADTIHMSEQYTPWFTAADSDAGKRFTVRNININNMTSSDIMKTGRDALVATAFISRQGIIRNEDLPFLTDLSSTIGKRSASYYKPVLRVSDVAYLPSKDDMYDLTSTKAGLTRDMIKQQLMKNGAVDIGYFDVDETRDADGNIIPEDKQIHHRSAEYNSYYYEIGKDDTSNHEVLIVGWDDNFSREHFADVKPSIDGAWLIRNSWGNKAEAHDGGYFWMSYEQHIDTTASYIVELANNEQKIYGYDDLGWCNTYGYKNSTTAFGAAIFQADKTAENVKRVAFYTTDNDAEYTVYIYDLGTTATASPVNGTLKYTSATGKIALAGYHTININTDTIISSGHYFSVVVKITNSAYEFPIATMTKIGGYSDNAVINTGKTYASANGTEWEDLARVDEPSCACIKAFTESTTEPIPAEGIAINSDNFPDSVFRNYISANIDTDKNDSLSASEIASVTNLNLANRGITSLEGIQYFSALTYLNCEGNDLTALDLSGNTALTTLECSDQEFTLSTSKITTTTSTEYPYRLNLSDLNFVDAEKIIGLVAYSGNTEIGYIFYEAYEIVDFEKMPTLLLYSYDVGDGLNSMDVTVSFTTERTVLGSSSSGCNMGLGGLFILCAAIFLKRR